MVAANGGSDYFYVPGHDATTVKNLVKFLQQREEYGAIFVDSRYGAIPGTLTMAQVNLENATRQNNGQPDVVVSFNWDSTVSIQGMPGIEFESFGAGQRGMHGSFGIADVHNTLIANGPSFQSATTITNPSGNVDVAPTVAYLLGTVHASGRRPHPQRSAGDAGKQVHAERGLIDGNPEQRGDRPALSSCRPTRPARPRTRR